MWCWSRKLSGSGECVLIIPTSIDCPKDAYSLVSIDKLVDNSTKYELLSFMDVYSNYNQIHMYEYDREKTVFMIEQANYQYNVMSFGLENAYAMYHRMMNMVFKKEIDETLEVYMDDMIVKSNKEGLHDQHIACVFRRV